METLAKALGLGILWVATLFIVIPLGTLFGAFAGWVVGHTFLGGWVLDGLGSFGVRGIDLTDFGALMGFAGGFLRTKVEHAKS